MAASPAASPTSSLSPVYAAETPRLYLQPMSAAAHLDDFHTLASDAKVMAWSTKPPSTSIEQSLALLLLHSTPIPPSNLPLNFAILLKPPPDSHSNPHAGQKLRMIGEAGIVRRTPRAEVHWEKYGRGEDVAVGYKILSEFWGKGLGGEAVGAVVGVFFGMDEHKLVPHLVAQIDPSNAASQRMMQKLGATMREGVVRGGYVAQSGEARDTQVWVIERPKGDGEVAGVGGDQGEMRGGK